MYAVFSGVNTLKSLLMYAKDPTVNHSKEGVVYTWSCAVEVCSVVYIGKDGRCLEIVKELSKGNQSLDRKIMLLQIVTTSTSLM